MGTRAVYTFRDGCGEHHVYSHWDNYPLGAAQKLLPMLNSDKTWTLPRFEADEFAAGFVAELKLGGGGIRLTSGPSAHPDIEYHYEVFSAQNGQLILRASKVKNWGNQMATKVIFYGRVKDFADFIKES